jgi:hypothetical protein
VLLLVGLLGDLVSLGGLGVLDVGDQLEAWLDCRV